MSALNFNNVKFIKTAASASQLISSSLPVIVFAGKSNVGKSSAINTVLNRKNLAFVGNTPGKTANINYFLVDGKAFFADLPGYGFAKVPKSEQLRWAKLMEKFFELQDNIRLGVLIVDARHKPTDGDIKMAELFASVGCSFVVLANKIDKVKSGTVNDNLSIIRSTLNLDESVEIIPFSSVRGDGKDKLLSRINLLCMTSCNFR